MPNRLASETSPYLLQHADNPVDWYPWGDEAFSRARREDKPVLVSIGYAACHWCHVMEHESFEDASVADVMNESFVCVKVDREERPDVDAIYMDAVQAMTGQGGWPLNAFLTPDGVPFWAGTYFPPQPRHGLPSWRNVLDAIADAWVKQRDEIDEAASRIVPRLQGAAALEAPDAELVARRVWTQSVAVLRRSFDGDARRLGRRAEVPGLDRDRVPAGARRAGDAAADPAPDGGRRHLRPGRRRLRALLGRRALARAALREDALRQRAAGPRVPARVPGLGRAAVPARVRGDARLGDARVAPGRGRLRLVFGRGLRGRRGEVLRLDVRPRSLRALGDELGAVAVAHFGVTEGGNFEGRNILVRATSDPP